MPFDIFFNAVKLWFDLSHLFQIGPKWYEFLIDVLFQFDNHILRLKAKFACNLDRKLLRLLQFYVMLPHHFHIPLR